MFTIEHEFDATVITLVDDGETPLREDIIIAAFEDCVTVTQIDERTDLPVCVTLSMAQLRDLSHALNLPEGSYRLRKDGEAEGSV
ncbi:MAG: hypothetical protein ACSHWY_07035 [Octadecabacter sp.]